MCGTCCGWLLQGSDEDPHEEVADEEDSEGHLPQRLRGKTIWHTPAERESWRASVAAATTASNIAYCAASLVFHAQATLQALAGKHAPGSSKQKPTAAAQQAGSSRGGSRRR